MSSVGDLGRRIAERREELALSTQQVAERAGMDPSYLGLVEHSASPQLTRAALWRLSAALETTADALTGGRVLAPPGGKGPKGRAVLHRLEREVCERLIAPGGVGRIVFDEARGPVAIPVNFKLLGHDVVLRTGASAPPASAIGRKVSFEVDHIDDALGEGWSVLMTGRAHIVVDPDELREAETLGIVPWAGGERHTYVRLVPEVVTGRSIRRSGAC